MQAHRAASALAAKGTDIFPSPHNRPRARPRTPNRRHGLGLALLFLITTVAPSADGSAFSSTPKTEPHEYAINGQYGLARQELQVTNVTGTWQIQMLGGVIVLTSLYLLRWKLNTTTSSTTLISENVTAVLVPTPRPGTRASAPHLLTGSNTTANALKRTFPRDGPRAMKKTRVIKKPIRHQRTDPTDPPPSNLCVLPLPVSMAGPGNNPVQGFRT
jgi:hypothetical protein